jgi:predicted ester cyclase
LEYYYRNYATGGFRGGDNQKEVAMDGKETVIRVLELIESDDMQSAAKLLADDFTFSGPVPKPVDGAAWLGLHHALNLAFPDFQFNARDVRQEGDKVYATVQITGTQKRELDLTSIGLPKVPASGKSIRLSSEHSEARFMDGKLQYLNTDADEHGGIAAILSQLGVSMPERSPH